MKKIMVSFAFVLALAGAFAGSKHNLAANVYTKPGGVCTLNCTTTVTSNACSATAFYSSLTKCQTNQADIAIAYQP